MNRRNMEAIKWNKGLEEIVTSKYRSEGERKIASFLDSYGIPYIYEKPILVIDNGKPRIWYPDFSVYGSIILEYFGIQGDADYDNGIEHKKKVYAENQIEMIPIYPSHFKSDWQGYIMSSIRNTLENRLQNFNYSTPRAPLSIYTPNHGHY